VPLKIHAVMQEPVEDDDGNWFIIVKAEDGGDLDEVLVFGDPDEDLYPIVRHCKSKIEPLEF